MDLFELTFENIDITNVKYVFSDFFFGNVTSISSLPQANVICEEEGAVEHVIFLLNTQEEYVSINFEWAKFGDCHLHKLNISFYKYDGGLDVTFLFEQEYAFIAKNFLIAFRAFSERKFAQLKAKRCFFGLEPSTDEDTQLFCYTQLT